MLASGGIADTVKEMVLESEGLRIMVASLWAAILLTSIAGFLQPRFLAAVLPFHPVNFPVPEHAAKSGNVFSPEACSKL